MWFPRLCTIVFLLSSSPTLMMTGAWLVPLQPAVTHRMAPHHHYMVKEQQQQQEQETSTAFSTSFSSSDEKRIRDIFRQFAQQPETEPDGTVEDTINQHNLGDMLRALDLDATDEDAAALFRYLDTDESGSIRLQEFLPWYTEAAASAKESARIFQTLLRQRRTVDRFDPDVVQDDVLHRAIACAIAAPNRKGTEPWRFIQLGPETVHQIAALKQELYEDDGSLTKRWTQIPGWCVVTYRRSPQDPFLEREDFKSTCCAVQNFMLSMWSEGIGTKWTDGPIQRTDAFAKLCGIDTEQECVAGVIWYGFAQGGLRNADPKRRDKGVMDVLTKLP